MRGVYSVPLMQYVMQPHSAMQVFKGVLKGEIKNEITNPQRH